MMKDREQKGNRPPGERDNVVSFSVRRRTEAARNEQQDARASRLPIPRKSDDDDSGPPAA
jgi:hypothetical protein